MNFKEELLKVIKERGLTNLDIAYTFEVSVSTVERWRNGITTPHPIMQELIIKESKEL